MKKSKKESQQLLDQFKNPLDTVQAVYIENTDDAEKYLSEIETKLKNKSDWQDRGDGIQLALGCLKGGITNYPFIDYSTISSDVASCIVDLRSMLVRTSSILVAASAQVLKEKYITSLKAIIPALFKQLTHGTALISESCHHALIEIVKNVPNKKTFQAFSSKIQSKSLQHRMTIAELILTVLENWPTSLISSISDSISSTLQVLLDDPSQNVKKSARRCMLLLKSKTSESLKKKISKGAGMNYRPGSRQVTRSLQPNSGLAHFPKVPKVFSNPKLLANKKKINPSSPVKGSSRPSSKQQQYPEKTEPINNNSNKADSAKKTEKKITRANNNRTTEKNQQSIEKFNNRPRTPVKQQTTKKAAFGTVQPKRNQSVKFVEKLDDMPTVKDTDFFLTLPVVQPKGILKPAKFPNVIRENVIQTIMPPKSMEEADSFQQQLIEIVEGESFEKLSGVEDLLCSSIVVASQYIPMIEDWESILPILIEEYSTDFQPHINDLITSFRCDPWLIAICVDEFGAQYLAELFMNSKKKRNIQTVKFFKVLFNLNVQLEITDKLREFLQGLIEQFYGSDEVRSIEVAIAPKQPDVKQATNIIISKLKKGENCNEEAEKLNAQLVKSPKVLSSIETILNEELPPILEQGNKLQRDCIYDFASRIPSISFTFLVDPMINIICNEDHESSDSTKNCLLGLMNDRTIFSYIIGKAHDNYEYVNSLTATNSINHDDNHDNTVLHHESGNDELKEQCTLSLLLSFFQDCSEQVAMDLFPETFEMLSPMLESNVTALRRIVVLILVEFKCKIPKSFEQYSTMIPTKHQKLIELYTSRRKARPI